MRLIIFAFVFAAAAAPASAATYSWPLQVSLPISISGAVVNSTNGFNLQVQCKYYPKAGGGGYQFNGIYITPTLTNGIASYSGTLNITVNSTAAETSGKAAAAPMSGDKITCTVVTVKGSMQSSGSTSSSLTLQ